jgi:hypothetical protein
MHLQVLEAPAVAQCIVSPAGPAGGAQLARQPGGPAAVRPAMPLLSVDLNSIQCLQDVAKYRGIGGGCSCLLCACKSVGLSAGSDCSWLGCFHAAVPQPGTAAQRSTAQLMMRQATADGCSFGLHLHGCD